MKSYTITVNGKAYDVQVVENKAGAAVPAAARIQAVTPVAAPVAAPAPAAAPAAGANSVTAPMPGKVLSVQCTEGAAVAEGAVLITFEAMKMENEIMAPAAGTVSKIYVKVGDMIEAGSPVVDLA